MITLFERCFDTFRFPLDDWAFISDYSRNTGTRQDFATYEDALQALHHVFSSITVSLEVKPLCPFSCTCSLIVNIRSVYG